MPVPKSSRVSGFRGTWKPNQRPYITLTPDVYVALQGSTSIIACGDCQRTININAYVTGISTEASVDSPPGSATINLAIPDNDVNNFYVDGQLIISPMMEVEIYAKGYYLQGGLPQYYRIFWGLVSSVTKDWSGGTTTVTVSCKDILRWWEVTNVTLNTAWLNSVSSSAGGYNLWQNQFAGINPYVVIIQLAQESMGDFATSDPSIAGSFTPEAGPEGQVIGSYAKDIMTYWQYKFANIWTSLRIFGVSGHSYQFTSGGETVSPSRIAKDIFLSEQKLQAQNKKSTLISVNPKETKTFKKELVRAGSVEFTQNDIQSKLTVALQARDQAAFEFFCDPSGEIVFKPPFYNLNVIPNKPVSWIYDFEIIDDSLTDTEQEVYTHITSQGIAFGGCGMDTGLTDEITAPRTGAYDFHLMKYYGFRRMDYQTEWASDPRKLFFHLMDYLDRTNAKRQNGTFTIPMRPELKLGYPVWVPYYDSFFYVTGISHQYSVGGQATTTLTWIAKRSKFIAPKGIGEIKRASVSSVASQNPNIAAGGTKQVSTQGTTNVPAVQNSYVVTFPDDAGSNAGLTLTGGNPVAGQPISIRDPKTGKLLGYPNVVMVFKNALGSKSIQKALQGIGSAKSRVAQDKILAKHPTTGKFGTHTTQQLDILKHFHDDQNGLLLQRLRAHRYEAAMTNAGNYDYAHDVSGDFIEIGIISTGSVTWNPPSPGNDPNDPYYITNSISTDKQQSSSQSAAQIQAKVAAAKAAIVVAQKAVVAANQKVIALQKQKSQANQGVSSTNTGNTSNITRPPSAAQNSQAISDALTAAQADAKTAQENLQTAQLEYKELQAGIAALKPLPSLDMVVRPVSDEFGFETIGHYRYGRGAIVDRGQILITHGPDAQTPGTPVNQLSIQFAATAGTISDASTVGDLNTSVNFAAQFDKMQPEDYITGASFQGATGTGSTVDNIQFTSASTYSSNMEQNRGHSVFIEADQSRKSKTLAELTPNIDPNGKFAQASFSCACGLERANWLSILPSEFIQQVLNGDSQIVPQAGTNVAAPDINFVAGGPDNEFVPPAQPINGYAIIGQASPESFFDALGQYLSQKFDRDYKQNAQRELQNTGQSQNVVTQLYSSDEADVRLGDPSDISLLGPASLGDPAALQGLQNEVNFNFGQTAQAVSNFKSAFQNGTSQINQALTQAVPGGPILSATASSGHGSAQVTVSGSGVTVTSPAPQVQPTTVTPIPNTAYMILNPSPTVQAQSQKFQSISGQTPGGDYYGPPTKVGQG
jgi:hypothetical protein